MRANSAGINRLLEVMGELEMIYILLEVDSTIYQKVLNVMFNREKDGISIFKKVITRMSGFHIVLCMIPTIYSRFKYAGIVERLSAARLGGK